MNDFNAGYKYVLFLFKFKLRNYAVLIVNNVATYAVFPMFSNVFKMFVRFWSLLVNNRAGKY